MSEAMIQKIKRYYDKGIYTISDIDKMLEAGKITQEEFDYIVGAN